MECLRRQGRWTTTRPARVEDAARFGQARCVEQHEVARGSRTIVRLRRTDPDAPTYPSTEEERRRLLREQRDE